MIRERQCRSDARVQWKLNRVHLCAGQESAQRPQNRHVIHSPRRHFPRARGDVHILQHPPHEVGGCGGFRQEVLKERRVQNTQHVKRIRVNPPVQLARHAADGACLDRPERTAQPLGHLQTGVLLESIHVTKVPIECEHGQPVNQGPLRQQRGLGELRRRGWAPPMRK